MCAKLSDLEIWYEVSPYRSKSTGQVSLEMYLLNINVFSKPPRKDMELTDWYQQGNYISYYTLLIFYVYYISIHHLSCYYLYVNYSFSQVTTLQKSSSNNTNKKIRENNTILKFLSKVK